MINEDEVKGITEDGKSANPLQNGKALTSSQDCAKKPHDMLFAWFVWPFRHSNNAFIRFEVGVYLLLAPAGADKGAFSSSGKYSRRFAREYPPELQQEPGLTESTGNNYNNQPCLVRATLNSTAD